MGPSGAGPSAPLVAGERQEQSELLEHPVDVGRPSAPLPLAAPSADVRAAERVFQKEEQKGRAKRILALRKSFCGKARSEPEAV